MPRDVVDVETLGESDILFAVDPAASDSSGELVLDIVRRVRKKNGAWGKPKALRISQASVEALPHGAVRDALTMLAGARLGDYAFSFGGYPYDGSAATRLRLTGALGAMVIPPLCAAGRLVLGPVGDADPLALAWDNGEPWSVELALLDEGAGGFRSAAGSIAPASKPSRWERRGSSREVSCSSTTALRGSMGTMRGRGCRSCGTGRR